MILDFVYFVNDVYLEEDNMWIAKVKLGYVSLARSLNGIFIFFFLSYPLVMFNYSIAYIILGPIHGQVQLWYPHTPFSLYMCVCVCIIYRQRTIESTCALAWSNRHTHTHTFILIWYIPLIVVGNFALQFIL